MKEVSTRALSVWFAPLEAKGIPPERMVAGTSVSLTTLRNRKERLFWSEFVAVMKNLRPYFTDDEYVDVGRSYFRSTGMQFAFVIARELFTPMDFYRWINKPRQGVGNQMFTCVVPTHRELSETRLEVDLELVEPHEVYWDFFIPTIGNFEEMPRLLGCPPAVVHLSRIPRGARYHITVPQRTPVVTRIRRTLTWPFTVQAAARELKDAHETLQERYGQLEDARTRLDRQRDLLDTAYRIGQQVFGQRDLAAIGDAVTRSLVGVETTAGARLRIGEPPDAVEATAGTIGECADAAAVDLPGSPSRGRLWVWPDGEHARSLIGLLAPTLALAIDNAIAYRELDEYRRGLEIVVEKRTGELRQARDELSGIVDQLREAQGVRERFFANISHEIRTPLSLILLAAGDVEAKAGHLLDERGRANLSTVADSARKLVRLVDELLLLAAGDETKLALKLEPTDLTRLVTTLGATWLPAAEGCGLTLRVRAEPGLVVMADPIALERIATNLVSNAVKYTPAGGTVDIEAVHEPLGVRLSVLDTGPGIAPELRSRLFGRFERGASGRSGSGIGLSLVKQLVVAHGGNVEAVDRPDGGTELRVTLPDHRVVAAAATTPVHPRMLPADYGVVRAPAIATGTVVQARRTARGTILVAEDDAQLADLLARLLSDEYKVVVALDGRAAIDMVRKHQPQLLVTDVEMPAMDGIELARQFRELTGDKLAPIIILSAVTDVATRLSGLEAGAVDYVLKPFDPRELIARVRSQFAMRDLAMRLRRAEQLSAMGTLAAGLAHELRNPANGLVNAIAPLRSRLPAGLVDTNSATGQLLEVIAECSSQVAFLSSQLLGFQAGGTLEMRTVGLTDVIERAIVLSRPQLEGVLVKQDLDGVGAIRCSPQLLSHVVANLIQNAAQAAGRGGWVEVTSRAIRNTVTVEVADSGPGVPPELRERVFEPFFTTKPGVGTGIGLPMAREIVQRHGGVLEIRERGGRVIFAVDIPAPQSV